MPRSTAGICARKPGCPSRQKLSARRSCLPEVVDESSVRVRRGSASSHSSLNCSSFSIAGTACGPPEISVEDNRVTHRWAISPIAPAPILDGHALPQLNVREWVRSALASALALPRLSTCDCARPAIVVISIPLDKVSPMDHGLHTAGGGGGAAAEAAAAGAGEDREEHCVAEDREEQRVAEVAEEAASHRGCREQGAEDRVLDAEGAAARHGAVRDVAVWHAGPTYDRLRVALASSVRRPTGSLVVRCERLPGASRRRSVARRPDIRSSP